MAKPVSLNRNILQLALPMIISNITVPLLGMVDTAVIGHLDDASYLGGVALGAMCIMLLYWLAGFLRMSTTGLAAQAFGCQRQAELDGVLLRGALLAVLIGLLLILLQQPLWLLAARLADGSDAVLAQARNYFAIRIWGAPAALTNLVLFGWLIGVQRSRAVMWLVVLNNSVNIVLDLLLVVGFGLGVSGVAWATLIAEYLTLTVGLLLIANPSLLRSLLDWQHWCQAAAFKRLLSINLDILLRSLLLQLCLATMTLKATAYGDQVIAANAVLMNFLLFASYGLDGIAYAAESLAGSSLGSQRYNRLAMVIRLTFRWSLLFGLGFSAAFWLVGEQIVQLLTSIPEVRATALRYIGYLMLLPLVAFAAFLFDGIFVGLTWSRQMRHTMAIAALLVFIPLVLLLQPMQNHGLWIALLAMFSARGLTQGMLLWRWMGRRRRMSPANEFLNQ